MNLWALNQELQNGDFWSKWPFGPTITGSWLATLTKFVFIGLVLAFIIWLLRLAFGPGGFLRDKDLDRESEEARKSKEESLDILRKRLASGEISSEDYQERKRAIEDEKL